MLHSSLRELGCPSKSSRRFNSTRHTQQLRPNHAVISQASFLLHHLLFRVSPKPHQETERTFERRGRCRQLEGEVGLRGIHRPTQIHHSTILLMQVSKWAFAGISTFAHLPHVKCLLEPQLEFDIGIIGVPFDTAVTYRPGIAF